MSGLDIQKTTLVRASSGNLVSGVIGVGGPSVCPVHKWTLHSLKHFHSNGRLGVTVSQTDMVLLRHSPVVVKVSQTCEQ